MTRIRRRHACHRQIIRSIWKRGTREFLLASSRLNRFSYRYGVGRGAGVGRGLGVGVDRGVSVAVAVAVGVGLAVTVAVAVAVGVTLAVTVAVAVAVGVGVGDKQGVRVNISSSLVGMPGELSPPGPRILLPPSAPP